MSTYASDQERSKSMGMNVRCTTARRWLEVQPQPDSGQAISCRIELSTSVEFYPEIFTFAARCLQQISSLVFLFGFRLGRKSEVRTISIGCSFRRPRVSTHASHVFEIVRCSESYLWTSTFCWTLVQRWIADQIKISFRDASNCWQTDHITCTTIESCFMNAESTRHIKSDALTIV